MPGAHRRSIEREHATALEDAIDDGVRQVVVQHAAPPSGLFVVKIIVRLFRWRSLTTCKSLLAASVPYVRYPTSSTTSTAGRRYRASVSLNLPAKSGGQLVDPFRSRHK
jgi:hypothetical protein